MPERPSNPRVVKRIVFAYSLDDLPGALILGHQQLKRKLERAGLGVLVEMRPLQNLPKDTDVLFVAPGLEQLARQIIPDAQLQIVDNFLNHPAYDRLIEELKAGHALTAPKSDERPTSEGEGQIQLYRGYERIN